MSYQDQMEGCGDHQANEVANLGKRLFCQKIDGLDFRDFWVRKFSKYFFGWLDLFGIFGVITDLACVQFWE